MILEGQHRAMEHLRHPTARGDLHQGRDGGAAELHAGPAQAGAERIALHRVGCKGGRHSVCGRDGVRSLQPVEG
jgi:hypothetical protein